VDAEHRLRLREVHARGRILGRDDDVPAGGPVLPEGEWRELRRQRRLREAELPLL